MPAIPFAPIARTAAAELQIADIQNFNNVSVLQNRFHGLVNIANKVVDSLGEPTRTILIRCYIEGKMYREVAQEFGVSTSAIKKHMIKALRLLGEFRKKC